MGCFDWEDISNTRDSVSSATQASDLEFRQISVLGHPDEHCFSCLISFSREITYEYRDQIFFEKLRF